MIGLSYIRSLYNISITDLSIILKLSKQAISAWEKQQRPIPSTRLEQLKEIFKGIDIEYFTKEIDELDMLKIQKQKNNYNSIKNDEINELEKQIIKEQLKECMSEVVEILTEKEDEEFLKKVKEKVSVSETKEDMLNNIKELLSDYNK